jgi:uncharacterized iron-regulated protein
MNIKAKHSFNKVIKYLWLNQIIIMTNYSSACLQVTLLLALLINTAPSLIAQDKPAYRIFDADGKEVRYDKMIKSFEKADVVFFGENHNDPISHWLELQVLKSLYENNPQLTLAMEMFESDNQLVLNEYLKGTIEEKHLLSEAKMWDNYNTDYKPLVDFAKSKKLPVVASNIPRRYANLVYRKGVKAIDSLSAEAKQWIAPMPVEIDLSLPGYKSMISAMGPHASSGSAENMARSQAFKDATMAYFLLKFKVGQVYHINGSYHSKNGEGIIWYLKKAQPNLKIATIHVAEQSQIENLEDANKKVADFIICVPKDMTKTY